MKLLGRFARFLVALFTVFLLGTGTADAARALSVTWAFLFPVPLPLPVWDVEHPHTLVTYGFLFPFWLPLPFYDYGERGPIEPRFGDAGEAVTGEAEVYIDGREAGRAADYSSRDSLSGLSDGRHTIELRHEGRTVYLASFDVSQGDIGNVEITAPDRR